MQEARAGPGARYGLWHDLALVVLRPAAIHQGQQPLTPTNQPNLLHPYTATTPSWYTSGEDPPAVCRGALVPVPGVAHLLEPRALRPSHRSVHILGSDLCSLALPWVLVSPLVPARAAPAHNRGGAAPPPRASTQLLSAGQQPYAATASISSRIPALAPVLISISISRLRFGKGLCCSPKWVC
jgi:hypothetical protein